MDQNSKEYTTWMRSISRKPYKKRHTLQPFTMKDVAHACGISLRTLHRYVNKNQVNLQKLTFLELIDFVNEVRESMKQKRRPGSYFSTSTINIYKYIEEQLSKENI